MATTPGADTTTADTTTADTTTADTPTADTTTDRETIPMATVNALACLGLQIGTNKALPTDTYTAEEVTAMCYICWALVEPFLRAEDEAAAIVGGGGWASRWMDSFYGKILCGKTQPLVPDDEDGDDDDAGTQQQQERRDRTSLLEIFYHQLQPVASGLHGMGHKGKFDVQTAGLIHDYWSYFSDRWRWSYAASSALLPATATTTGGTAAVGVHPAVQKVLEAYSNNNTLSRYSDAQPFPCVHRRIEAYLSRCRANAGGEAAAAGEMYAKLLSSSGGSPSASPE